MYTRSANIRRTCLDILAVLVGLALLAVFLTQTQTAMSVRRQHSNSQTKLLIARQRLETNATDAVANLETYDAFNQAKADSIRWFLDKSEVGATLEELQAQYQLAGLTIAGADGALKQSAGLAPDSFTAKALRDGGSATQSACRWYASVMQNGDTLIAAMDFSVETQKLSEMRSLAYSLSTLKVGTTGYVAALRNGRFAYHPNAEYIGQSVEAAGFGSIDFKMGFAGWVERGDGSRSYCEVSRSGDYLLVAVVPGAELDNANRNQVLLSLAIFAVVLGLLVAYCLILRRDMRLRAIMKPHEYKKLGKLYLNRTLAAKVFPVAGVMLVVIFVLTFYVQTLSALSRQSDISEAKLGAVTQMLDTNDARIAELREEYTTEYSRRAQNVAWLLGKDPALMTDENLTELAQNAQVSAIYVMNSRGRTVATNTVYKDFALSEEAETQSYPFWDVVKGYKDVFAQDAREDETGAMMQYVGVKRLDEKGMVQLGMLPKRLKARLAATELAHVLSNTAVENGGFLFATDAQTHLFLSYPNAKYVGRSAEEYGLTAAAFRDDASGFQTVDAQRCFVSCNEYGGELLFVAVPTDSIYQTRLPMTLLTALGALIILLTMCFALVISTKTEEPTPAPEAAQKQARKEPKGTIELRANDGKTRRTVSASMRWAGGSIPWRERTPEQKLLRMVYYVFCVVSAALVLVLGDRSSPLVQNSILSYIMDMKWERTVNLFSLTYIAVVVMRVWVISLILRKLIVAVTERFGARCETVGRLMDSFLKYMMVLGALFYGMNFVGVDSSTLLTSAGLLTLIVGLGSKSLISDILAGIFIVVEGEFRVGDIVTIGDWRGTVLEIGVRTTKIEDGGGNIKIFSNSVISGVINMTKQYSYAFCDMSVNYCDSLERVESVLRRELPQFKERIPTIEGGPFYKGVVELGDSAMKLRIVAQCKENDRVQLTRDMMRELKLMFDKNRIGLPMDEDNQPVEVEQATRAEAKAAEKFVNEQKELSKDIHVKEV